MTKNRLVVALPTSTFLPSIGGVEVGLHNIATHLTEQGHHPFVITPAMNFHTLRKTSLDLPYKLIPFPPKMLTLTQRWPHSASRLLASFFGFLQGRHRFDIWHGTVGFPTGVALIRFAAPKIPHLVRCAGDDIQVAPELHYGMRLNPKIDQLIRTWLPRADGLVAITESVAEEYIKLRVDPARIWRIPNGVDLNRFDTNFNRDLIRKRYGIPKDCFLFLAVGRNHPKKGFSDLIKATLQLVQLSDQPFAVAIAGEGTESLQTLVNRHRLNDFIFLLGQIGGCSERSQSLNLPTEQLVSLYQSADAFVFPSHVETFGVALVEAMAARLPIITTDSPGCRDLVENGIHGLMVPVENPTSLAKAMHKIQSDQQLRKNYSFVARKRALAFSWTSVVDRYVEAYQTIIAKRQT